jgi:KaiC/GvpD/RAD55 family RecA-like ATPase
MTNEYSSPQSLRKPEDRDIYLSYDLIRQLARTDLTVSIVLQQSYGNINEVVLAEMVARLIDDKGRLAALIMHLNNNRPTPTFYVEKEIEP